MNRLEKAQSLYNQLFDKEILSEDLELQDIMKNYIYGEVYQHGTLDLKLRELIMIVVNTTNHTLLPLNEHIRAGLKIGLSPISIKEAIYQCTPYIGLGKVKEALEVVNRIYKDKNLNAIEPRATVNEETRFEKGREIQYMTFSQEGIQAGYDSAPQELKHIQQYLSEYCFGDFYTRDGLDLKTRELITFVMLATLGGCENQLRAHTAANLKVENTRDTLIEAITQCQPYIGFPRTLNAINVINEITQK